MSSGRQDATRYALGSDDLLSVLDELGVGSGETVELYHRVDASDGSALSAGPVRSLSLTRTQGVAVTEAPREFAFRGLYPNPVTDGVRLAFDLPEPATVSVRVFDLLGREVSSAKSLESAGLNRSISLETSRLSSGVYVVIAEVDGEEAPIVSRFTVVR